MTKHFEGNSVCELRNFKLVQGQLFKINGKNHYRGVAPYPVTPAIGDTWEELTATGSWVESWFWDGTYAAWLSTKTCEYVFAYPISTSANAGVNSPAYPLNPASNILLLNFVLTGVQASTATTTNRWTWTIDRVSPPGITTTIASFSTNSPTVFIGNSWNTVVYPINVLINLASTSAKTLRVLESSAGNPSKIFNFTIEYKKARP